MGYGKITGRRALSAFALIAFAVVASSLLIVRSSESRFEPAVYANPVVDLLAWLPATDQSRRAYGAWVAQPGAPLGLADAIDRLSLSPGPLALGRSAEWQRTTGISGSQVSGWASAPGLGVTILEGSFSPAEVETRLTAAGYTSSRHRSITIWRRADPVTSGRVVEGDDLRAMNAIAIVGDRAIVGTSEGAVRKALDVATGVGKSLAEESIVGPALEASTISGIVVVDQRDLAIECGVGRGWLTSDFGVPSERALAVVYRTDPGAASAVTSVWMQFGDDLEAEAMLPVLEKDWRTGYVNQRGLGGQVSDLATVEQVQRIDAYVVADLTGGRDNGWVRSGVRYLVAVCEQASTLIPSGLPDRATPVASPSPMESP